MKKIKFLTAITAIGFAVTLFSCSKGDTGAAGPAGASGTNGANGTAGTNGTNGNNGTNGTNGTNGNANVKDSIFTVPSSSFGAVAAYDYYAITDPQITAAINATGLVTIFWSPNGGTSWNAMDWISEDQPGYEFTFGYITGVLTVYMSDNGVAANPSSIGVTTNTFKIICATADGLNLHPTTNWHDISQVNAIIAAENVSKN